MGVVCVESDTLSKRQIIDFDPIPCLMYQYDDVDKTIVQERVDQFRDQVRRYRAGELSAADLQHLRLRNGLYMQIHAHMLCITADNAIHHLCHHYLKQEDGNKKEQKDLLHGPRINLG